MRVCGELVLSERHIRRAAFLPKSVGWLIGYSFKDICASVVITKLKFFEIKREVFLGDAMVLNESFLGPTPESL